VTAVIILFAGYGVDVIGPYVSDLEPELVIPLEVSNVLQMQCLLKNHRSPKAL